MSLYFVLGRNDESDHSSPHQPKFNGNSYHQHVSDDPHYCGQNGEGLTHSLASNSLCWLPEYIQFCSGFKEYSIQEACRPIQICSHFSNANCIKWRRCHALSFIYSQFPEWFLIQNIQIINKSIAVFHIPDVMFRWQPQSERRRHNPDLVRCHGCTHGIKCHRLGAVSI